MSKFLEWVRHRAAQRGWKTQSELAEAVGVSLRTIGKIYAEGQLGNVERSIRVWLARTLEVTLGELEALDSGRISWIPDDHVVREPYWLAGRGVGDGLRLVPEGAGDEEGVPVLGKVAAGGLVERYSFDEAVTARLPLTISGEPRAFALEVEGDSMLPSYLPGEYVILKNIDAPELRDGEDAMIQLDGDRNGESCFKRVFRDGRKLRLVSLNATYPAFEVDIEHVIRAGRLLYKCTPAPLVRSP